jgi:hypothetical protein
MTMAELTRIDSRPVSGNRNEIRAFMVVWNDALRLASTLQHYRQLGVDRFFIVDCGSNDGTVEALEAAPDVHAFAGAGEGGIEWINTLLDRFGAGHWTLTVDADELFIYPHHEQLELPLFCRYLDYVGSQAVPCVSLDMYAASPIGDAVHKAGAPLLDTCRYFDAGPYRMVQKQDCPYIEIHGGLRERVSGRSPDTPAPVLTRVPLVRWQAGTRYLRGTGSITPMKMSGMLAALLRFDFLADFAERTPGADISVNLYSDSSARFDGSMQLVELGLMKTEKAYEESVQLTATARAARSA